MMKKISVLLFLAITFGMFLVGCQHKHTYDAWTTLKEAKDYEEGLEEGVCIECGEVTQRVIKALISNGSEGITYELSEDGLSYIATGYTGNEQEIVIGSYYYELPVIRIRDLAFNSCDSLTTIKIPATVTNIGEGALGCKNLVNIRVDKDNPVYRDMSGNLYTKDGEKLVRYAVGKSYSVFSVPEGVTSIGSRAFSYSYKLTNVVIPDEITEVGEDAFLNCNLNYTRLNGGYYLGNENNPYLVLCKVSDGIEACEIDKGVKVIQEDIFKICQNLKSIIISESNQFYKVTEGVLYTKDGKKLLNYPRKKADTEFSVPKGVEVITDYALYQCDNLVKIALPDDLRTIGEYAFAYSENITTIKMPINLNYIGNDAFRGTNISNIIIPEGVSYIGDRAFLGCDFVNVEISKNVTTIGDSAFDNCDSLESINVSKNNQFYKDVDGVLYTKDGKSLITYPKKKKDKIYTIPSGVLKIEAFAFQYCLELTEVIFPEELTEIGIRAFEGCKNLENVSLSKGLVSIGDYAFFECEKLENVNFCEGLKSICDSAFASCVNLTNVTIPKTVTNIEQYAFYECSSLSEIKIPNNVTIIGYKAFGFCDNLTIYCSVLTKPEGWNKDWNWSSRPVIWGIF